jgi:glycosyltransferase involved in cell wall biosynthesis
VKVVLFSASFPPVRCGVGDYMAKLAAAVAELPGHHVTVFTATTAGPESGTVGVSPVFEQWTVREFLRRYFRVRRERPDLVIAAYPAVVPTPGTSLLFFLPPLARILLPRARVVMIVHEFARTQPAARRLLRITLPFAHEVVVVNGLDGEALAGAVPRVADRLRTVPVGSNIPAHPEPPEQQLARPESRGSHDAVILHFGYLQADEKGFEDLVDAVRLLDRGGVILCASGSLDDRPFHDALRRHIEAAKVPVHWLGHLGPADAARWLQAADVVVLPFRLGAAENRTSLIAALVNGAAVVTTRGRGTPEYLQDGENVMLVPPRDPQALAQAIERCLASEEFSRRLRRGAAALAPRFDWTRIAADILDAAGERA